MVFARFHLNGAETSAQAVPVQTGSGSDGVTVSPSPAICCNCRVRPPFLGKHSIGTACRIAP